MTTSTPYTVYNGTHYRNEIEARWAILADFLNIELEYMKISFFRDGGYLPDFIDHTMHGYLEIQPTTPRGTLRYTLNDLALELPQAATLLALVGPPTFWLGFPLGINGLPVWPHDVYNNIFVPYYPEEGKELSTSNGPSTGRFPKYGNLWQFCHFHDIEDDDAVRKAVNTSINYPLPDRHRLGLAG